MTRADARARIQLLERGRELAEISAVLEDGAAGRGSVLVIEGPGGIGKSHLLTETGTLAEAAGMEVLRARGDELERTFPLGLISSLLESRFGRATAAERRQLLRGRAQLAASVLVPGADEPGLSASTDEFALLHGLYWAVVNLSERTPLALLVDDVHWGDDLSLRFLIYLAQRVDDLPVTIAVAIRTGDPSADHELVTRLATRASTTLRPAELSEPAVRELFAAAEVGEAGEQFARTCWETTRGNPFLLSELVASLANEPALWGSDPSRVASYAPQAVGREVVLRLTRHGSDALALARACSVLGDGASLAQVAEVAGIETAGALEAADRLATAQILASADPVSFTHPMIRSSVYAELPAGEGPRMHLLAAEALHGRGAAPEELAHHLLRGAPCREAWATEVLGAAGRAAARRSAPATAVRYLRAAVESAPQTRDAKLLVDLGLAEAAAGETNALAHFETALSELGERAEQARALYALGQTLYRYGRHADAAAAFQRGGALIENEDPESALTFDAAFMCCAMQVLAVRPEAFARLERVVAGLSPDHEPTEPERVMMVVHATYRALSSPPADEAAELTLRALGEGALLREQTSESMAVGLAVIALVSCERLGDARALADAARDDASARGSVLAYAEVSLVRAMAMRAAGRIAETMTDAQAALDGMDRGWHAFVPVPQALLAHCLIERGDLEAAETVLRDAEPLLPGAEAGGINSWFHWARGGLRLATSDPAAALEDFLKCSELLAAYGLTNPVSVPWRVPAALAARAAGREPQARELLEEELGLARSYGLRGALGAALHACAVIEGELKDTERLEEAVEVLDGADAPLELSRALHSLGGALRRRGDRVASREPLRRALDLAHDCGALALERRIHEELLASGARPRRAASKGRDSLTPSERRIAELVVQGHTNRDVAETLFVTKSTVEWHLKRVYQKVGVRSREELKERFASEGREVG